MDKMEHELEKWVIIRCAGNVMLGEIEGRAMTYGEALAEAERLCSGNPAYMYVILKMEAVVASVVNTIVEKVR